MQASKPVVGVDLGGTKMLAAVVDSRGSILSEVKRATKSNGSAEKIVKRLAGAVQRAIEASGVPREDILAVGVGAPAPVDPQTGFIHDATNVPSLSRFPLGERLAEMLALPVFVDNDVNAGTVGEHALGAGRGTSDMVGIFVGTGTGGGVILDGRLRHGFRNSAGEVGHMVVGFRGLAGEPTCGCGRPGCLEAYGSRTAIEREIRDALADGRKSCVPDLLEANGKKRITSGILAKALDAGDGVVEEAIDRATEYLAILVASIVNLLDPEMIVIGGGVAEALGERLVEPIRRAAPQWYLKKEGAEKIRIVLAELGDYAGVLGAATIARRAMEEGRGSS